MITEDKAKELARYLDIEHHLPSMLCWLEQNQPQVYNELYQEVKVEKFEIDWSKHDDDVVSVQHGYITYDTDSCTQWFEVGNMIYRPKPTPYEVIGINDDGVVVKNTFTASMYVNREEK